MKKIPKLAQKLNLNYLKYTNKTVSCGKEDLPELHCDPDEYPDFLALYSETGLYSKTKNTAVCFYKYDEDFAGFYGLHNAIYYNVKGLIETYKLRFDGVKIFISPDYSELGDIHIFENNHRLLLARIVSLWLHQELGATVIPNITAHNTEQLNLTLTGLEKCAVVAFSTKGHMNNPKENAKLREYIKITVDKLTNLKAIVVYDVCGSDKYTLDTFKYASDKDIKVIIPNNTLKEQNRLHKAKAVKSNA